MHARYCDCDGNVHMITILKEMGLSCLQRVLEHCSDPKTQSIVMDEILRCVCMLAQDQYGNYVVQVCYIYIYVG